MIEVIDRAVIIHRGKILLCKSKDANYYFLPGGHVEFGETLLKALSREIKEELGTTVKSAKFIDVVENVFTAKKRTYHELDLIFRVRLKNNKVASLEKHIEFHWVPTNRLKQTRILPTAIKKILLKI